MKHFKHTQGCKTSLLGCHRMWQHKIFCSQCVGTGLRVWPPVAVVVDIKLENNLC